MDNLIQLKKLAVGMVHDALQNVIKRNQYSKESREFLLNYEHSWCASILDIAPEVLSRGVDGILDGSFELGSLANEVEPKRKDPLRKLKKDQIHHHGSVAIDECLW